MRPFRCLLLIASLAAATPAAAQLVVINARGPQFKVGQRLDGARPVTLKPGEQITLIGADGRSVTLRGPFSGPPVARAAASGGSGQALAALVASRQARSSAVGVVRSGSVAAAPLPEPWLIDISRAGPHCLKPGAAPVWWRPDATKEQAFTVFPIDRSWRADFRWAVGQDRMAVPPLARFEGTTTFIFRVDGEETLVAIERAPAALDNDLMLASWMIEKDCSQQADALLRDLEQATARP